MEVGFCILKKGFQQMEYSTSKIKEMNVSFRERCFNFRPHTNSTVGCIPGFFRSSP